MDLRHNITVEFLKINFSSLSLEQKIQIKNSGRPKPDLNLTQTTKGKSRDYIRTFKTDMYNKNEWICGCETTNRLFCFPCLLFSHGDAESAWNKNGIMDLGHLSQKIKKHENTQAHINAQLELQLLGKVDIRQQLDSAYRQGIQQHNDQVRKNRYVLTKIIDCIKFCGAFELALRGHDEKDDSANPGVFKGLINFSTELDIALKDHFEKSTVFKGVSKTIQNELLDCMLQVTQENIKKEISKADYVAVMADETTDVANCYQLTTVFRYVLPDGTPVERFWNFVNPPDHDALSLSQCIKTNLEQVLDKSDKLISQSYDGASVMSGRHAGVQTLIKNDYKYAFFIHCYAHQLNLILSQATSQNQEVRVFFSNLSDISNFFSHSPQRVAILDEIVGQRVPRSSATRWNFKSRAINTVYEYRELLIECMEKIEATSKQTVTINQATGICRMLKDSKFVFWLTVFHRILPHADILYNQLQKTVTDPVQIHEAIKCFENCIQKERENLDSIRNEILEHTTKRRNEDPYISRNVAAKEVCDTVIIQVKERFSFTKHLNAAILFSSDKFSQFEKKFPMEQLESIVEAYPFLDKVRLQTELEIIYRRSDFRNLSGAINLLKFLIDNNLQTIFSATFNLLQIIITIPMTTAEAERNFSTLKRIKTFLRSSMNEERLSALAMLSIEKKFIDNIVNFNDEVVDKFSAIKTRRMDFIYKHCTQMGK